MAKLRTYICCANQIDRLSFHTVAKTFFDVYDESPSNQSADRSLTLVRMSWYCLGGAGVGEGVCQLTRTRTWYPIP